MSVKEITTDDYAKLSNNYCRDADLFVVADVLDAEHQAGYLVWLYWPHLIATAKQAKAFGWFRKAPKMLAQELNDHGWGTAWNVRQRMFDLLQQRKRIEVRQGVVSTPSEMVDVRLCQWDEWQSQSSKESSRLTRERKKLKAGRPVHWTVAHLEEFRHGVRVEQGGVTGIGHAVVTEIDHGVSGDSRGVTESGHGVTENGHRVRVEQGCVTTQDKTYPLPPTTPLDPDERDRAWSLYNKALDLSKRQSAEIQLLESLVGQNPEVAAVLERMRSTPAGLISDTQPSGEWLHDDGSLASQPTDTPGSPRGEAPTDALSTTTAGSQPTNSVDTASSVAGSEERA